MSIFAELKGRYCEGAYSFKGAYVYLTIINFISLSIILTALFTYLDVYHREWLRGKVKAHGMFWCVKGPIMVNFYFGEILLSILTTVGVIKGSTAGSIEWPADAVKNGINVIIICFVMMVDSFLMLRFFGPADNIQNAGMNNQVKKMTAWHAFVDGYLAYIPHFIRDFLCCGVDSYKLAKKRKELSKRKKQEALNGGNSNPTDLLLHNENGKEGSGQDYRMNELNSDNMQSQQQNVNSFHASNAAAPQQQPLYQHEQDVYPSQDVTSQTHTIYNQQETYPPQQYQQNNQQRPF